MEKALAVVTVAHTPLQDNALSRLVSFNQYQPIAMPLAFMPFHLFLAVLDATFYSGDKIDKKYLSTGR